MSVINKMLRDLDQRHVARPAETPLGGLSIAGGLQQGTHSVPADRDSLSNARMDWRIGLIGGVCVALGMVVWYATLKDSQGGGATTIAPPLAVSPAPVSTEVAATAPQPIVLVEPQAPAPQASAPVKALVLASAIVSSPAPAPAPAPPVLAPTLSTRVAKQPETRSPVTAPRVGGETVPVSAVSLPEESAVATIQALDVAVEGKTQPTTKPEVPYPEAAPSALRRQQASADVLSQAQTLWSSGSNAAAIDLTQQALDAAERAVKAGSSPPGNPVLLSLVREWTRMQMALGHYGAVWGSLSRLEPILGNAPDLWGLRGNTAQRLGRHADSVHAYTMALQLRPNEQRWMLGAAVSMAALGQTDQAAAMADKAQGVGNISNDVQAYLHQMGVPLKPR